MRSIPYAHYSKEELKEKINKCKKRHTMLANSLASVEMKLRLLQEALDKENK